MDFQHRPGGKTGSGGVASSSESNRDRRERLRQLALETIDINKVGEGESPGLQSPHLAHLGPWVPGPGCAVSRYISSLPGPVFHEEPPGIL